MCLGCDLEIESTIRRCVVRDRETMCEYLEQEDHETQQPKEQIKTQSEQTDQYVMFQ